MSDEREIGTGSDEEFQAMQALCAELRALLSPLDERQHQLVGLYILSALYLGQGRWEYNKPIKRYLGIEKLKPALRVVGAENEEGLSP